MLHFTGTLQNIDVNIVNYTAMAADVNFYRFGDELVHANTSGFNQQQYYAFWMNAYNYLTIKLVSIINNYYY
jgi:hypothetical protein